MKQVNFHNNDIEVSVIMAVYNLEQRDILELSIKSILNQTMENIEFIICDDASTDNTYSIIKDLTKNDNRVKLLKSMVNRKAGGARNMCLQYAQGKYIAIMDADDFSTRDRLEKQVKFLEEHQSFGFVGSKGGYFNKTIGDCIEKSYWFKTTPIKKDFLFSLPFVHASIMFRKEVLDKCQGYNSSILAQRAEDYDMLIRIYELGYIGANINEKLYYIREDTNTFKRRKYRFRFIEAIVKLRGFYQLGLMPIGFIYAMKPLLVGLIPLSILKKMSERYYKTKTR